MFAIYRIISLVDQFPQSQQFRVSSQHSKLHSVTGALSTISLVVVTLIYMTYRLNVLINFLETTIFTNETENVFTGQDFLNVTVGENLTLYKIPFGIGITVYDKDYSWPYDLDKIGTLKLYNQGHFFDPVKIIDIDVVNVLKTHNCTREELHQ